MLYAPIRFVATLGDMKIIGPAFLIVCVLLWVSRHRHEILPWMVAFCLCAASVAFLKWQLGSFDFNIGSQNIRARGLPSGHTAMSVIFYGQLAVTLWRCPQWPGKAIAAMLATLTILICAAVYEMQWHSLLDIAGGLALGGLMIAALQFRRFVKRA